MTSPDEFSRPTRQALLARAKHAGIKGDRVLYGYAVNQLLHRLNSVSPDGWMLKGGDALVTRSLSTRATRDIDARSDAPDIQVARQRLEAALIADLGDGILFQQRTQPTSIAGAEMGGYSGLRFSIEAILDGKPLATIKFDVVTGKEPIGEPERVVRVLPLDIPGVHAVAILMYPVIDHIADKICATLETHGEARVPSSRVKDVYDLCALRQSPGIRAGELIAAIEWQVLRRGLEPSFAVDIPGTMKIGYEKMAQRTDPHPLVPEAFEDAVRVVAEFLDPILSGTVIAGTWDPIPGVWVSPAP